MLPKRLLSFLLHLFILAGLFRTARAQSAYSPVAWPEGKRMALSLSFDDARLSNVDLGTRLLDRYGVKATFFVLPSAVKQRLEGWKRAVASGHEIGNHSVKHPCSGNFGWARPNALETYTPDAMRAELLDANRQIEALLGVRPAVFAYPCGQTFVGRGVNTRSYVPVVAELFVCGRGWLGEAPNDPGYCDLAQVTGMEMDGKDFSQIRALVEKAKASGQWLVLAGHETAESGPQTTRLAMLRRLCAYAKDPANGIWIAPVGTVAKYVQAQRK
jgi:peptidoglycan/xylan/chitin deacetylase (PgdA/CDA1 family)